MITSEVLGMGGWGKVRVAKLRGYRVAAKCLHQHLILSEYNSTSVQTRDEHLCQDSPSKLAALYGCNVRRRADNSDRAAAY